MRNRSPVLIFIKITAESRPVNGFKSAPDRHPLNGDGRLCERLVVVTPAFALQQMPPPDGAERVMVGGS